MTIRSKINHLRRVLGDVRWWPFYLQRKFLNHTYRNAISNFLAKKTRPKATLLSEDHSQKSVKQAKELMQDGITHLGALLSKEQAQHVRGYFETKLVHDTYRSGSDRYLPRSNTRHPNSHIAHHDAKDVVLAPYLLELANNKAILDIVSRFLGCRPTIAYMAAWWSYPTPLGPQQAENFHRDVDDWRFVKLFIYLSDVNEKNGPHIYVRQSSCSEKLRQIRRFTDDEVVNAFGSDNVLKITGNQGEGFLEDTFGFHKGQPLEGDVRLIFQTVYSMYPLPYSPNRPVIASEELGFVASDLDAWSNRIYLKASAE